MIQLRGLLANHSHGGWGIFLTFSITSKSEILQSLPVPPLNYWQPPGVTGVSVSDIKFKSQTWELKETLGP